MRHVRAMWRVAALSLWTGTMYLMYLATRLSRLVGYGMAARSRAWCFRSWSRGVGRVIGLRVEVRGAPPSPPCFLVTNHLSYLDVVTLGMTAGWAFVAKSEVARWPVIGFLARSLGVIFVDRDRRADLPRVIRQMGHLGAARQGLAFFPEGTSTDGSRVLPFRASLFAAPIEAGLPVACGSLSYRTPGDEPPARLAVCWWGDMTFADHFYALLQVPRFDATVVYAPETLAGTDRKQLAEAAHTTVCAHFIPVTRDT